MSAMEISDLQQFNSNDTEKAQHCLHANRR
jgi:hypothetical protein